MTAVLPSLPEPDPDPDPGPGSIQQTPVRHGFISEGSAEPAASGSLGASGNTAKTMPFPAVASAGDERSLPAFQPGALCDNSSFDLPFSTVRRWRRVLAGIAAGLTVGALTVTAIGWFTSHRSAQRWHRHADASDIAVRSAVATVSALQSQLDDTRAQLSSSQADARALQGRLDQLAAEKAKVEDEREAMKTVNARLQDISQALSVAVAGANNCSSQATNLLQRASRGSLTATQVETEAARVDGVCQKADADRQIVVDLLDRLNK